MAHGTLVRARGKLIASDAGPLGRLYAMAVKRDLFVAERETLVGLSGITIVNKMLEGE